jgi:hypothetical protein
MQEVTRCLLIGVQCLIGHPPPKESPRRRCARGPSPLDTVASVSAPWVGSATPIGPPADAVPGMRDLLYAAAVTGIWSGLLSLGVYGLGRLMGVPFEVAVPGSSALQIVPWFAVALLPVIAAFIGAALSAFALGHRHARRVVFWAGTLLAIASCLSPLMQPDDVLWSTRIWLLIPHAITWFLVVPQIARIVGDSEPGMFESRMSGE